MKAAGRGNTLRIQIRLASASLDRVTVTHGRSIAELELILTALRREQIERGIIKP